MNFWMNFWMIGRETLFWRKDIWRTCHCVIVHNNREFTRLKSRQDITSCTIVLPSAYLVQLKYGRDAWIAQGICVRWRAKLCKDHATSQRWHLQWFQQTSRSIKNSQGAQPKYHLAAIKKTTYRQRSWTRFVQWMLIFSLVFFNMIYHMKITDI